jgi:hypothetical protein
MPPGARTNGSSVPPQFTVDGQVRLEIEVEVEAPA